MSTRSELMKYRGHYLCPGWCLQPDDEGNTEEHCGDWASYRNPDGDTIEVRPMAGWDEKGQGSGKVEIRLTVDPRGGHPGIQLTGSDWYHVETLISDAQAQVDGWVVYDPPQDSKWAYAGAEDDQAEADDEDED